MDFLKTVNAKPFDIELMKRMLTYVDDMPAEQRADMTGRSIGLIRFLDEQEGIGNEHMGRAHTLMAFEFRMEALARLRDRPEYQAWTLRLGNADGADVIHEVLVETAATEPLIEIDKHPAFDPAAFFAAALLRAEAEGRA